MQSTQLQLQDKLPLTCSRSGTCCHGNRVMLNPWEIAALAQQKNISAREFRDLYCDYGGIRLRFDGNHIWRNKKSCSQYIENFGCSVHLGRPLVCRLFPLGRQIQSNQTQYIYQGEQFPCLDGCPEVSELTHLTVGDYIQGQQTQLFEEAQNAYLELMQKLADIAFELLLETELVQSPKQQTLAQWRIMGNETPDTLAARIGTHWIDSLMLPQISFDAQHPITFANNHHQLLLAAMQESFGNLQTLPHLHDACCLTMALTLHLARALGAQPENLAEHWIITAKNNGATE